MILPPQAFFEITRQCNQSCTFCSCVWHGQQEPLRPEMSVDEWKNAAEELIANGVQYIAVTGGEPTLREDAMELFRHIADLLEKHYRNNSTLALFTNGKNVSHEWFDLLKKCKGELYTSLPGLRTFAVQTGEHTGDFRQILKFINAAAEHGIRTSVGVTITKLNLFELYEICSYSVLSGANTVILNLFKPSGRGAQHPNLLLSEDDIRTAAETADEVASKCGADISFGGEFPAAIRQEDYPHIQIENRCVAARGTFTVAPDGWLHVCEHDSEGLCYWRNWHSLSTNPLWKCFSEGQHAVCPLFPDSRSSAIHQQNG